MNRDLKQDLELALKLSKVSEEIALTRYLAQDLVIETKPDASPVTDADQSIEKKIREILGQERPKDLIIGEEFGQADFDGKNYAWVIDPIDGTKNFLRGIPTWAVLIALLNPAKEIVVGVVAAPALFRKWYAVKDEGAFVSINNGTAKQLKVSRVNKLSDASLSYSDLFGWEGRREKFLELQDKFWRVRGLGDFWSHILVAEGAVEIAAEPSLKIWDMAACAIIVTEAGGKFTDLKGVPGPFGRSAVSSNGLIHNEFLDLVNGK